MDLCKRGDTWMRQDQSPQGHPITITLKYYKKPVVISVDITLCSSAIANMKIFLVIAGLFVSTQGFKIPFYDRNKPFSFDDLKVKTNRPVIGKKTQKELIVPTQICSVELLDCFFLQILLLKLQSGN